MSAKTATIVGASGFIGKALVRHLADQNWQCILIDRNFNWTKSNTELGHVFYCAGLTSDYLTRPRDTIDAHVTLLTKILCEKKYKSLTYLSSTRLYDGLAQNGASEAFNESIDLHLNPNNPRNLFDISKALGESICNMLGNGRARVARLSCVYHDLTDSDGFLPELMRKTWNVKTSGDSSKAILINSQLNYYRDYVALRDVLVALQLIAENGRRLIYNVASGENVSNQKLFQAIKELIGVKCEAVNDFNDFAGDKNPRISISAMKEDFSWSPVQVIDRMSEIFKREIVYAI